MSGRVLPGTFGTIRFRVPRVAPGRYKVFVYCEPCYRGRRGSLITDDRIFRVVRAGSGGKRIVYARDRLSFVLPSGWHVTSARINGVVDPVTIFTATSFGLRHPRPSDGICSVTLQRQWHVRGAYVQLSEERDGASRKRMLRRVPPRELEHVTGLRQSLVSYHLGQLREAGLVVASVQGRSNRLARAELDQLAGLIGTLEPAANLSRPKLLPKLLPTSADLS
jgi:DNA-binding transcriptional ArsR family regulator